MSEATVIPVPQYQPTGPDDVAGIIRSQVPTMIWWEIGARGWVHTDTALQFVLKAANNRLRRVQIALDRSSDLYNLIVGPVSIRSKQPVLQLEGVGVEQLVPILRDLCENPRRDLVAAGWENLSAVFDTPIGEPVTAPTSDVERALTVIAETRRVDIETGEVTPLATVVAITPAPAAPATREEVAEILEEAGVPAAGSFVWPAAVTPARPGRSLSRQLAAALEVSGVPAILMHTADRGGRLYYSTPAGDLTPGELADRLIVGGSAAALA